MHKYNDCWNINFNVFNLIKFEKSYIHTGHLIIVVNIQNAAALRFTVIYIIIMYIDLLYQKFSIT